MDFNQEEYGGLKTDVKYLIKCCEEVKKDMDVMTKEQDSAKNRTIATLVGVVVTLGFLALTYFR
jgi:hypothetical protein